MPSTQSVVLKRGMSLNTPHTEATGMPPQEEYEDVEEDNMVSDIDTVNDTNGNHDNSGETNSGNESDEVARLTIEVQ